MHRTEFARLMAGMSSTTKKQYTADEAGFWLSALSDVPDEALRQAFYRFVATGDDWPSIAKIRALADEQVHGIHPTSSEAFGEAIRAVREQGDNPRAAILSLSPMVLRVVELCGGWGWISNLHFADYEVAASRFGKAYDAILSRERMLRRTPDAIRPALTDGTTTATDRARLVGTQAATQSIGRDTTVLAAGTSGEGAESK